MATPELVVSVFVTLVVFGFVGVVGVVAFARVGFHLNGWQVTCPATAV